MKELGPASCHPVRKIAIFESMKIIASLLVLYFGLLMMQPFMQLEAFSERLGKVCGNDKCCKSKSQHKTSAPCKDASTCNTDFCNPFVPCGISIAERAKQVEFKSPVLELSAMIRPASNDDIFSNYLSDCWRPPELLS